MDETTRELVAEPEAPVSAEELEPLPPIVRQYFRRSLPSDAPVVPAARLEMRGHIKVRRWLPFTATQILSPLRGFVWTVRVAGGLVRGGDRYLHGEGRMRMVLLGLFPVVDARGEDLSRSAAGRCGGESLWVPAATLPRHGARWEATGERSATVRFTIDGTPLAIVHDFDDEGRIVRSGFARWGDPDETGEWGWSRFGGEVHAHRRFHGVEIPSAGTVGWHHGTDRWPEGEFFRYELTSWTPAVS